MWAYYGGFLGLLFGSVLGAKVSVAIVRRRRVKRRGVATLRMRVLADKQSGLHRIPKPRVADSIPAGGTKESSKCYRGVIGGPPPARSTFPRAP